MLKTGGNAAKPPRFPYVGALLCAACVGTAGCLWMRYSYAWDVSSHIHDWQYAAMWYERGIYGEARGTVTRVMSADGKRHRYAVARDKACGWKCLFSDSRPCPAPMARPIFRAKRSLVYSRPPAARRTTRSPSFSRARSFLPVSSGGAPRDSGTSMTSNGASLRVRFTYVSAASLAYCSRSFPDARTMSFMPILTDAGGADRPRGYLAHRRNQDPGPAERGCFTGQIASDRGQ